MASLLQTFTFDRNTFKRSSEISAQAVIQYLSKAQEDSIPNDKKTSNVTTALSTYMGVLRKDNNKYTKTPVADIFEKLFGRNKADAWQWLVTRSLWKFVIPNGTGCKANEPAKRLPEQVCFLHKITSLLYHLSTLPSNGRYLYYDEFCDVFKDDKVWPLPADEIYRKILENRQGNIASPENKKGFLDLEPEYGIGRDNFNGLFNKALDQTGLFEFIQPNRKIVGIALSSALDGVLSRRLRFIMDNPPKWDPRVDWMDYLTRGDPDFPHESSLTVRIRPSAREVGQPIEQIVKRATDALNSVNFRTSEEFCRRFVAALLTKPFLILTGLTGSGKTKLAQLFAAWITRPSTAECFASGMSIQSDRIRYFVKKSSNHAVEFWNSDDQSNATKVTLPLELIYDWVDCIRVQGFTKETRAREIREAVEPTTKFSPQQNSFETHLKAAAFHVIEYEERESGVPTYKIVPVGADWTSNENIVGYPDALDPKKYVRTEALNLLLSAHNDPHTPYFLILDEMNLSHVERYFADLLSAIESHDFLHLHSRLDEEGNPTQCDGVPGKIMLPENLYIIGTVNVDETTYLFSPKVLDRASVLEFRVDWADIAEYLSKPEAIDLSVITGQGANFAESFVQATKRTVRLDENDSRKLSIELGYFFNILRSQGWEFGYRGTREMANFLSWHKTLTPGKWSFRQGMDAIMLQKILPRLHGSRKNLEPMLCALAAMAFIRREWDETNGEVILKNTSVIDAIIRRLANVEDNDHPLYATTYLGLDSPDFQNAEYGQSFYKICRMLRRVVDNGFTSFAEA